MRGEDIKMGKAGKIGEIGKVGWMRSKPELIKKKPEPVT
jgi:hypothetical protein